MASAQLPTPLTVAQALAGILNKDAKASIQKTGAAAPLTEQFIGRYDDGAGNLEAVVAIDMSLAASCGAALALIPAGVAKDAIKAKKIEGDMLDNAYEVANILANSFVGKRVRLVSFEKPGAATPETLKFAGTAGQSMRLEVVVPNYPGGQMTLFAPALPT